MNVLLKDDAKNEFCIKSYLNYDTCSSTSYFSTTWVPYVPSGNITVFTTCLDDVSSSYLEAYFSGSIGKLPIAFFI